MLDPEDTALTEVLLALEVQLNYLAGSHRIAHAVKGALEWESWLCHPIALEPLEP